MKREDLVRDYFEGILDEAGRARLIGELRSDPAFRESFARQCSLHGMLGVHLQDAEDRAEWRKGVASALRNEDREEFVGGVRSRVARFRKAEAVRRMVALAACLALVAGIAFWTADRRGKVASVATVVETNGVSQARLAKDQVLESGDVIRFDSGLVELDMEGRGTMVLEGPVEIEFTGPMSASLREGRAFMKVTPAGHGYRLDTPHGEVVDLGTAFGVVVNKAASSVETHVLEGEVRADLESGGSVMLRKDEGILLKDGSSKRIHSDGGAFYSSLPPGPDREFPMVHWSLDSKERGGLGGGTAGGARQLFPLDFHGEERQPESCEGPFGQGLSFSGSGDYAESTFPGVEGAKPRTVAFWVKVPADFDISQGYACVSWGQFNYEADGQVWQVSINPGLSRDGGGPVGRLRLGIHRGFAVGTTDLRDGQWHHVAIVLYEAGRPDVGKHVIMYVDGKMEPISTRLLGAVHTVPGEDGHGVLLGRDITGLDGGKEAEEGGYFRGGLDELYIFEGALTQKQILDLMTTNRVGNGTD